MAQKQSETKQSSASESLIGSNDMHPGQVLHHFSRLSTCLARLMVERALLEKDLLENESDPIGDGGWDFVDATDYLNSLKAIGDLANR